MSSVGKNTLLGSSGNGSRTLTKYVKHTSHFLSSRGEPKQSLTVKRCGPCDCAADVAVVASLQKRKGVGPGGASSELLQASGSAAAVKLAEILSASSGRQLSIQLDGRADTLHLQAQREPV